MAELSYSMSCIQSVLIDSSQYMRKRTSFISQRMYLGGGIIRYNAEKDDRSNKDFKNLKEEVVTSIVNRNV